MNNNKIILLLSLCIILIVGIGIVSASDCNNQTDTTINSTATINDNQQSNIGTSDNQVISTTDNTKIDDSKNNQNTNEVNNHTNTEINKDTQILNTNQNKTSTDNENNNIKSIASNNNQQYTATNINLKNSTKTAINTNITNTFKTTTKSSLKTASIPVDSYTLLNDTINNAPIDSGTIIEITSDFNGTGWINITSGKNITINGNNHTISAGDKTGNFLWVESQSNVLLNNITITKYSGGSYGTTITNYGNLTIINSVISNSTGTHGAIQNFGNLTITGNNTFRNNNGVANDVTSSVINYNYGGAIYNDGSLVIDGNNTFENNILYPGEGGAIYNYNGILNITGNNIFTNNSVAQYIPENASNNETSRGGAIYNNIGIINIIGNNTFSYNNATNEANVGIEMGQGGGVIFNYKGLLYLIGNNTFSYNNASYGGVIYNDVGNFNITGNNTFLNNNATMGGVIDNYYGTFNVTGNNTFSYNNATSHGGVIYIFLGAFNITGNNTFSYNNAGDGGVIRIFHGTENIIGTNNFLNNYAYDGGAIYNKNGTLNITNNNTFLYNNATYGSVIYNLAILNITGNNTFSYSNAKNIGAIDNYGNLNVTGNNTFSYNTAIYGGVISNFNNSNIYGNNTFSYNNATNLGGAIVNRYNLNITGNNSFSYNNAKNGGAISNYKGTINITGNNTFSYNNATDGGVVWNRSNLTIINNTFYYNNALDGGVFYLNGTSVNTVLNGLVLNNNTADDNGAVIYNTGVLSFGNSTAIGNYVTSDSGFVIYNTASGISVINNTFLNNTINNRDMLMDSTVTDINVNSNYYSNNMLNTTISPIVDDDSVTNDYTTPVTVNLRSIYNDTVRNGTITVYLNSTGYKTFSVTNGESTVSIPLSRLFRNTNVELLYSSLDKDYQNATTSFTLITVKNDTITTGIVVKNIITEVVLSANVTDLINTLVDDGSVEVYIDNNSTPIGTYKLVDGAMNISLPDLSIGEHNISFNYTGTDRYSTSNTTVKVNVLKMPTDLTVEPTDNLKFNDTEIINGVLTDKNGKIIPNANVVLIINGVTTNVITDNNGMYTYKLPATTIGINTVIARYNGNEFYDSSVSIATFNVNKINTNITATVTNNTSSNVTITANITDINGNPVDNGTVIVYENGTILGTFNVTNGTTNITLPELPNGEHNLTLNYTGTDKYNVTNTVINVNVTKMPSIITVDPIIYGMVEDHALLNATVTDENGNLIDGGIMVFKINGETLKYSDGTPIYVNVTNGKAQLDYIIPRSWVKPTMTIGAAYSGTDIYTGSRATNKKIYIVKRDALINVTTSELSIKANDTTTFIANISDKMTGKLLNTGVVVFKFQGHTLKDENGTPIYVNVTNGIAELNYTAPIGISSHNYTVTAVYANPDYNRAQNTTKQFVNKTNTQINITSTKINSNLTITGTIKDILGNNVKGTNKIAIKVNGVTIKDTNNQTQYFYVKNGKINLTLPDNTKHVNTVTIVTGDRLGYFGSRTTTQVTTIKTAKQTIKVEV